MGGTVYALFALAICVCSVFLIAHQEYEDGLIGRTALAMLAFPELLIFMDWMVRGTDYSGVLPSTVVIQVGIGLFLVRHTYRFIRRLTGGYDWRPAKK